MKNETFVPVKCSFFFFILYCIKLNYFNIIMDLPPLAYPVRGLHLISFFLLFSLFFLFFFLFPLNVDVIVLQCASYFLDCLISSHP